jgi:DNA (cytosine-5)-methyltransferase 1
MRRLQTVPEGLRFDCGRNDAQHMLGNAVLSLLAEVIAREIRGQLLGVPIRETKLKLLPPSRGPVPPPERITKVPAAYLPLIGNHAAHPGEGRGAGRGREWPLEGAVRRVGMASLRASN